MSKFIIETDELDDGQLYQYMLSVGDALYQYIRHEEDALKDFNPEYLRRVKVIKEYFDESLVKMYDSL